MTKLIDLTLKEYLKIAEDPTPDPGGGSVAAYVGAVGTALAIMALNLSYDKDSYKEKDREIKNELEDLKAEFQEIIEKLEFYVDEDSNSFSGVLKAFKLPKETEEEKEARSAAIQEGYKYAMEVPMDTARMTSEVLENLEVFANHCSMTAITDVGCSILFVSSAVEAALQNVLINIKSIKDEEYVNTVKNEVDEMIENARKYKEEYMEIIYTRLEKGE